MLVDLHQLDLRHKCLKLHNRDDESRLLASLEREGQQNPIVVVATDSAETPYLLIDGFKRARAAKRLGINQLECSVWKHSADDALMMLHSLQQARERSSLEDAYLIRALREEYGLSLGTIAKRLGRTKSWASRRLGLVTELPSWLQDHIRNGEVKCYAASRYLIPLARTNTEHAKLLAKGLAGMNVTTRDVADLYFAWKTGSEDERLTVVTSPEVILAARDAATDSSVSETQETLLQDLSRVESLLVRASRSLTDAVREGLEKWCHDSLRRRQGRIWEAITRFDQQLMEVLHETSRSGNPKIDSPTARKGSEDAPHRPAGQQIQASGEEDYRQRYGDSPESYSQEPVG